MSVKSNQLEVPFTSADKAKLDGVATGAQANPVTATQAEAEAGLDNVKMMTPLRTAQAITALGSGGGGGGNSAYLGGTFANSSGMSLGLLTVVKQNTAGVISKINPSSEADVFNILGVVPLAIADGDSGLVVFSGLITEITTSFSVGDNIYLSKAGSLMNVAPDIGVNGFGAGDFVIHVGQVCKNTSDSLAKDLKVELKVVGQL